MFSPHVGTAVLLNGLTQTLWGDLSLEAVACEGSRFIRVGVGAVLWKDAPPVEFSWFDPELFTDGIASRGSNRNRVDLTRPVRLKNLVGRPELIHGVSITP